MSEFTPGPWTYRPKEDDDWGFVRGPIGRLVARAASGRVLNEDELGAHRRNGTDPYEANARLIAASPQLYDLAVLFRKSIEYEIRKNIDDGDDEAAKMKAVTLNIVRAALSAADGKDAETKP